MKRFVTYFIAALLFIMPSFSLTWRQMYVENEDGTKEGYEVYYFDHWPESQDFIDVMAYAMKLPNVTAQVLYSSMKREIISYWELKSKDSASKATRSLIEEKKHLIMFDYENGSILLSELCDYDNNLYGCKTYFLVYDEGENNE